LIIDHVSVYYALSDKPGAPEGPLEVTDISGSGCKLRWEPPRDTGGSPINNYIVEKMDVDAGEWKPITKYCRGESYDVSDLTQGL